MVGFWSARLQLFRIRKSTHSRSHSRTQWTSIQVRRHFYIINRWLLDRLMLTYLYTFFRPQQSQHAGNRRPPTVQGVSSEDGNVFFRRPDRNSTGHGKWLFRENVWLGTRNLIGFVANFYKKQITELTQDEHRKENRFTVHRITEVEAKTDLPRCQDLKFSWCGTNGSSVDFKTQMRRSKGKDHCVFAAYLLLRFMFFI